jgi:hypothetical protein
VRPRTTRLATLLLAAGLLVGCGGDEPSGGDAVGGAATTAPAPGGAADDAAPEGAAGGDAFCDEVAALGERFDDLGSTAMPDPEVFREVSASIDEVAAGAPEDIADDMDALAAALRSVADIFADVDLAEPGAMAELQARASDLEAEAGDVRASAERVQTYLTETCGVDLEAPGGDDDATTG